MWVDFTIGISKFNAGIQQQASPVQGRTVAWSHRYLRTAYKLYGYEEASENSLGSWLLMGPCLRLSSCFVDSLVQDSMFPGPCQDMCSRECFPGSPPNKLAATECSWTLCQRRRRTHIFSSHGFAMKITKIVFISPFRNENHRNMFFPTVSQRKSPNLFLSHGFAE